MRLVSLRRWLVLLWAVAPGVAVAQSTERPICRIAAVSNLYLTDLPAEKIVANRRWIAATAPAGIKQTIATVNALKPDALLVMGSLTWTGSAGDFERVRDAMSQLTVPYHVLPGPRDLTDGGRRRFEECFGARDVSGQTLNIRGVHLQCIRPVEKRTSATNQAMLKTIVAGLAGAGTARAVLLVGGPEYPAISDPKTATAAQSTYWKAIKHHKVAARLTGGHAHSVTYADSLPTWSVPSSGWSYSPKFHVALISVYPERLELSLVYGPGQPPQTLTLPNPVTKPRLPTAAADPFGVPTYSEDLALKPELTFVQLSDSQFDDFTVPRYKARYASAEQMNKLAVGQVNRLKPAWAFMTGDLTNKNTEAEWKTFGRIYGKLKVPLYPLPGNHDTLYDRSRLDARTLGDLLATGRGNWRLADKLAGRKETDPTALYRHFMGRKPYYSLEKKGCVFLCLNTGMARVDAEQMAWFRKELKRTRSARHVFVLGHYPVLPKFGGSIQGPEAAEILVLLRQYKVTAYLSGHRHRYDYRRHDGVMHILCDCLCWGEYRSYQVYHVFPDRIVACWKPIFRADGNRPLYERVVFPESRYRSR